MNQRTRLISLSVVTIIFSYMLTIGATFNGILNPEFHPLTLSLMAVLVIVWMFTHWRSGWVWHRTPLDIVFLLWGAAFVVSLLANWDTARRIVIGLWYVGVYVGVWYILHDAIQNRFLHRETLIDGLMIGGVVIVTFGYLQLQAWLRQASVIGFGNVSPPRPVSVFGNPNFLSDFLVVLIPLILSRFILARNRINRIFIGVYLLLAFILLFLTSSRGAWLGLGVALLIGLGLWLHHYGLFSRQRIATRWSKLSGKAQTTLAASIVAIIAIMLIVSVIFIRSFSQSGRTTDLRTEIYVAAVELFNEKPLTGHGLFTFGRGLVRLPDIQPDKPHSHAHNVPLLIAAELGLIGLVALAATLFVMVYCMRNNWQSSSGRERILLIGAMAAVVAFAVHQLTDVPAMMPAIALTGLVALVLAITPSQAQAAIAQWRRNGQPVLMIGLWGLVLATGFWSSGIYSKYVSILDEAQRNANYRQAAEQLQLVIDADSKLSLYVMQQAFLYGMAASDGDMDVARKGVAAYENFLALDPGYAVAWANLAGLRWQLGERKLAVQAMQQAAKLDSVNWHYQVNLARYAEAIGDATAASAAYRRALTLYPDASLYTELRSFAAANPEAVDHSKITIRAQIALLLESGEIEAALQLWTQNPQSESVANDVMQSLLLANDRDAAANWLSRAENLVLQTSDQAWVHLGRARLVRLLGDTALVDEELRLAHEALTRKPLETDDAILINIAYAQFLRFAIPRQFLPQVYYPVDDPVLMYLLDNT